MAEEKITLTVGGKRYRSWTRAAVTYGIKATSRAFAVTVTDDSSGSSPWADQWNFMPGTAVTVESNGDLLVTGFIDRMTPSYDHNNHHVEISGKSKSADSVKAHAEHPTHEFKDKTALDIAKELDKQGVGFKLGPGVILNKIPLFRLNPGESVHTALDRIVAKEQLLLFGQADGSVHIAKGGTTRTHPSLVEGQNILGASATFDDSNKKSSYKVKGQQTFGGTKGSLQITGESKDSTVKRNIPKIIHSPTDIKSKDEAKKLAKHHRDRQQGESISASVKVQGFHDSNGSLWVPNTLIHVYSPMLKLDMDLLLESVSLTQDLQGSFTQLSLVHPKAHGSSASTGSKSKSQWKAPEGE